MTLQHRAVWALITSMGAMAAAVPDARGDYIWMSDGRLLQGEVLEQNDKSVVFRHMVAKLWTTQTLSRRDIDSIVLEDGDQSDRGTAAATPAPDAAEKAVDSSLPKVVVIPLHGSVGLVDEDSLSNCFDATVVAQCLTKAAAMNPRLVVLDIQSPGGLVSEMEAICQTIISKHRDMRIVAYPRDAFSAAAVISLCCKEMVVRSDSRIGAAVIIQNSGKGATAVDAKMASPHHALQRQFMAASGRPYPLLAAMTVMENELWWSEAGGFSNDVPPAAEREAWTRVDGATTVFTMTAEDAVRWKVAAGASDSLGGLLDTLGLVEEVSVVNMAADVERYNKQLEKKVGDLFKQFTNYFTSLGGLIDSMNALAAAYNQQNRPEADRIKRDLGREVGRLLNAGRQIAKIDKALLKYRVNIPDQAIAQIEVDAKLLARIRKLVETDTADGFNEAVDRVNAVLQAWKELIGR